MWQKARGGYKKEDKRWQEGEDRNWQRIGNALALDVPPFRHKTFPTQPLSLLTRAIDISEIQTPGNRGHNVRVAGQGTTCIHPITKGAEPAPDDPTRRVLDTFNV